MKPEYKKTTELAKIEKAQLHDFLGLHVPVTWDKHRSYSFCKKCGAPIVTSTSEYTTADSSWQLTTDPVKVKNCIESTKLYNKFSLKTLAAEPFGAYFIAFIMGKVKPEYRTTACKDPLYALYWAKNIDKKPSKETWLGVRFSEYSRTEYKKNFKLTDSDIRNKDWREAEKIWLQVDSLPSAANQFAQ